MHNESARFTAKLGNVVKKFEWLLYGNSFMGVCSRSNFFTALAFFEIPLEFADDANDCGKSC